MADEILKVNDLKTYFYTEDGVFPAVDGLSFSVSKGEGFAIVGESGCGKSVTSLSVLNLVQSPPGKIISGEIIYRGEDLLKKSPRQMREIRGREISMIFQDPMTSLNPAIKVGRQIMESLIYHTGAKKSEAKVKTIEMLKKVGIADPEVIANSYPYRLSGGMTQRVMIAMALILKPHILIADEPTTALDVTVQAQILKLLRDLQKETETAIILITHDLGVVAQAAQNVMVMYAGEAVEYASVSEIFARPLHPYTAGLLACMPKLDSARGQMYSIRGKVPSAKDYPQGCRFSPRCDFACERCYAEKPELTYKGGRLVRCLRSGDIWK